MVKRVDEVFVYFPRGKDFLWEKLVFYVIKHSMGCDGEKLVFEMSNQRLQQMGKKMDKFFSSLFVCYTFFIKNWKAKGGKTKDSIKVLFFIVKSLLLRTCLPSLISYPSKIIFKWLDFISNMITTNHAFLFLFLLCVFQIQFLLLKINMFLRIMMEWFIVEL